MTIVDIDLGIPKNVYTEKRLTFIMNGKKFMRDRVVSAVAIIAFVFFAGLLA